MQFYSEANNNDLCSYANREVGLSISDVTRFTLVDKTAFANEALRIIRSVIGKVSGGWVYDDKNQTDFPEYSTTLTSGQKDYSLPTAGSSIIAVSIKQNGTSDYKKLTPITIEQILDTGNSELDFQSTNSEPIYYSLIGGSIKLYPTPNYTQASSLIIQMDRDISSFAITDTTKVPGIDNSYHEAIGVYMALKYAKINQMDRRADLEKDWFTWLSLIESDYSRKFREMFPPRMTVNDAVQEFI